MYIKERLKNLFLRILKNLKPKYFNEKYLIKDKNGHILKKSENLKSVNR